MWLAFERVRAEGICDGGSFQDAPRVEKDPAFLPPEDSWSGRSKFMWGNTPTIYTRTSAHARFIFGLINPPRFSYRASHLMVAASYTWGTSVFERDQVYSIPPLITRSAGSYQGAVRSTGRCLLTGCEESRIHLRLVRTITHHASLMRGPPAGGQVHAIVVRRIRRKGLL